MGRTWNLITYWNQLSALTMKEIKRIKKKGKKKHGSGGKPKIMQYGFHIPFFEK